MLIDDLKELFDGSISPISKSYAANEFVFCQGDRVQGLFGVEKGQIRFERFTPEGRVARILVAESKEWFAEAALFSRVYHCYAVAARPSTVILFPKDEVLKRLREDEELSMRYIELLSSQVRDLRAGLALRSILSARERILQYLVSSADADTGHVKLSGTLKGLAEYLGLAHETLYRELKKLEADGIIERADGRLVLLA